MGGQGGVDPYNSTQCPFYQRLCGQGIFQGKGAYMPEALLDATQDWILPDTVLSHDLLEGELAGCAADSTLCLYDGAPAAWSGWLQRLHRWTRGDWQLLPWLLPWVQTPEGLRRNPLSAFSRHKLWDNLRRSLLPIGQAGILLLSALPKSSHSADSAASLPAFSRPQLPQASGAAQCSCRSSQEKYASRGGGTAF